MAVEISADGSANGREKRSLAKTGEQPETLEFVFDGSLSSAKHSSIPAACNVSSNSASMSAAVTSTLVTGSAATTSQLTGAGDFAAASKTRALNSSALAKNNGASQRNSTRPGIWRALG